MTFPCRRPGGIQTEHLAEEKRPYGLAQRNGEANKEPRIEVQRNKRARTLQRRRGARHVDHHVECPAIEADCRTGRVSAGGR